MKFPTIPKYVRQWFAFTCATLLVLAGCILNSKISTGDALVCLGVLWGTILFWHARKSE